MGIASVEIVCTVMVTVSASRLYLDLTAGHISPFTSWDDTHVKYSKVVCCWLAPFCAFVFSAFFGFAEEARLHYAKASRWVRNLPPFRRLFPARVVKGTVSLEKAAGWPSKQDGDALPVYSVHPPRPPPFSSLTSSGALSDDGVSMSDSPYYEKFPQTPSSAGSDLSDLSHHDSPIHGAHAV